MKLKNLTAILALTGLLATPFLGSAEDKKPEAKSDKVKPYTLKTCPVSDEKLGEMGDPYVFTHEGREIKLCCKSCQKDFKKNPAKFIKKIEDAEKKSAKKS
jgi:hypothetical protein